MLKFKAVVLFSIEALAVALLLALPPWLFGFNPALWCAVIAWLCVLGIGLQFYWMYRQSSRRANHNQDALQDLLAEYKLLINAMPIYFYVVDVNADFRFIKCNDACAKVIGRPLADILGKNHHDLFPGNPKAEQIFSAGPALLDAGKLPTIELPLTGADGNRRIGRFYRQCLNLSGGRRWLFGLAVDITEAHNHQTRLHTALQAFESAFYLTKSAIFRFDPATSQINGPKNLGELWPIVDGKALPPDTVIAPLDLETFQQKFQALLDGKIDHVYLNYSSTYFGDLRQYRLVASLDRNTGAKNTVIGVIQEATASYRQEQKYQESLRLQNMLVNSIPVALFVKKADAKECKYELTNRAFNAFRGLKDGEAAGKSDRELFLEHEAKLSQKTDRQVLDNPDDEISFTEEFYDRHGKQHIFNTTKRCFIGAQGEKLILGTASDITDLQELSNNQLALNNCFGEVLSPKSDDETTAKVLDIIGKRLQASRVMLLCGNDDGKIYVAGEYLAVPGKPLPDTPLLQLDLKSNWHKFIASGQLLWLPDVAAAQKTKLDPAWQPLLQQYPAKSLYACRVMTDGRINGVLCVAYEQDSHEFTAQEKLFLVSGAHLFGIWQERRQSHAKLLELLENLSATVEQSQNNAKLTQSATCYVDQNWQISGQIGDLQAVLPTDNQKLLPFDRWVVKEDYPALQEQLTQMRNGFISSFTTTFRTDFFGERRYCRMLLAATKNNGFMLVLQNVSDVANSTAKLQAHQELWDLAVNTIPSMLFVKNADRDFCYEQVNQAFLDFFGKTAAEVIGHNDAELFPEFKSLTGEIRELDRQIMLDKTPKQYERDLQNATGTIQKMRLTLQPFTGMDGTHLLLGLAENISELSTMMQYEEINSAVLTHMVSETDWGRIIDKILNTMRDTLKCDRVIFAKASGPDDYLQFYREVYSAANLPLEATGVQNLEALWNTHLPLFKNRRSVLYDDLQSVPEVKKFMQKFPNYPTKSFAAAPVFVGQKFFGLLMGAFLHRHHFSPVDEKLLLAMTNIITLAQLRNQQSELVKKAERQNQLILDNVDVPIWLFDPQGRIITCNRSSIENTGISHFGNQPYNCRNLFACTVPPEHCPVKLAAADGEVHQINFRYPSSQRDYRVTVRPIKDDNGNVVNLIQSAIDVTDLNTLINNHRVINRTLSALLRGEDLNQALKLALETVAEHVGAAHAYVFKYDAGQKTVVTFGEYSIGEQLPILDQYREQPHQAAKEWSKLFKDQIQLSFPDVLNTYKNDGLEAWGDFFKKQHICSLYAARILFKGKFWGYLGLSYEHKCHNLTEEESEFLNSAAHCVELMLIRKNSQDQILDALDKARAADKAKSMFLASMSHEIRTPLNAVIGFSELLCDTKLPAGKQKEYLHNIASAGNTLLSLINDVLDLSKLEAGQMTLTQAELDFAALAKDTAAIFQQKCEAKNLTLRLDLAPDLPLIYSDQLRLRQILFNLLGNAVKFTAQGTIALKAVFTPANAKIGQLKFSIIDTGIGINAEDQKKLFQMFVQAGNHIESGQTRGTGLGLALVRHLVECMHGKITLQSAVGKGSNFTVELNDLPYADAIEATASQDLTVNAAPPDFKQLRVLLVDDVDMNLKVMAAMLKKLGVEPKQCSSGAAAYQKLEKQNFDLLLTDLWMPGQNGAELAVKVRTAAKWPILRIVALTADTESGANFDMTVFDEIMSKPVTIEKMQNLLSRKLEK